MATLVNGNEIILTGTVGDLYWDDCFTSADVIFALAQVGRDQDVTIRLNSGGGIATEGAAIHAAIAGHKGRKVIVIEGIAASAASVIAMAGDEIVMSLGALMMVHDPSGFTFGTIEDHQLQIRALTALATAMAGIYSERTGKTVAEARADMQAEIWMTPEEAVAAGYADRTLARAANDDVEPEPTAFDYRLFSHSPERLVALADQRAWTRRVRPTAATPTAPARQKETSMTTEKQNADSATKPDTAPTPPAPTPVATVARSDASEIAKFCVDGGVPAMAATLLAEGVTVAQAKERIGAAGEVKNLVALARRKDPTIPEDLAATMLADGKTVEQARAALFDKLVAGEERTAVSSHVPADGAADPASRIVANYRAATGTKTKAA
ncbi:Clp protease ClpP [Methylobacterium sp. W2]|uniref:head maturation protease, ClpP-related n=1 Tax=Methylobacterium sp. W2 TaxID=2598107 RepID=UPI001D0C72CC|nr:head maturation protease, ClpP-related [Methylobacterium sp. W2]MCC0808583.1 Clp protease ClpP [Methylobacterium sp. W2]